MESEPEDLDALLRRVMENYFPQPREGIEQRVLHRVRSGRRRVHVWFLASAGSVAALLLFVVMRPARVVVTPVSLPAPATVMAAARETPVLPLRHHKFQNSFQRCSPFRLLQEFAVARPQDMQKLLDRENEKPLEMQSNGGQ